MYLKIKKIKNKERKKKEFISSCLIILKELCRQLKFRNPIVHLYASSDERVSIDECKDRYFKEINGNSADISNHVLIVVISHFSAYTNLAFFVNLTSFCLLYFIYT